MPEGPTIRILRERLEPFIGRRILAADGYAQGLDPIILKNQVISDVKSFGKNLLICFHDFTVRVHMGLFGSYQINSHGKRNASLGMHFSGDEEVNFYISRVWVIEQPVDKLFDWSADLLSPHFSIRNARTRLLKMPEAMICDALLDQDIFAGSGNIIKNEVLFRVRVHPESRIGKIPPRKLTELIKQTRQYSFDFLEWKKAGVLSKNFKVYEQEECPRNHIPLHKADLGKTKRHTYWCEVCQRLFV